MDIKEYSRLFSDEDVTNVLNYLSGNRPIPDISNSVDVLGDIEGFDVTGW